MGLILNSPVARKVMKREKFFPKPKLSYGYVRNRLVMEITQKKEFLKNLHFWRSYGQKTDFSRFFRFEILDFKIALTATIFEVSLPNLSIIFLGS